MVSLTITVDENQLRDLQDVARRLGVGVEELVIRSIGELCAQPREESAEVSSMYPHLARTFGPAGWDDPEMDSYNALDPRKQT